MVMNKKYCVVYSIIVVAWLLGFIYFAYQTKQSLIAEYNQGVQYFESGDYLAAVSVFNRLQGWGRNRPISPEDYCQMSMERLNASGINAAKCPHCGWIITADIKS